jgi:hypothetical protein
VYVRDNLAGRAPHRPGLHTVASWVALGIQKSPLNRPKRENFSAKKTKIKKTSNLPFLRFKLFLEYIEGRKYQHSCFIVDSVLLICHIKAHFLKTIFCNPFVGETTVNSV